jgi:hypothetical protein
MVNPALESLLRAGLSIIPTGKDKRPALGSWKAYQSRLPTQEEASTWAPAHGLGVICGAVSGGLFCIDIDQKNDPTKKLMKDYLGLIREQAPDLITRMVVQVTPSKGFHMVGRCSEPIQNLKLAKNKAHEVLIETRGEGGYFCASPTPEYHVDQGDLTQIPEVTPEELFILLDCARALNQEERESYAPKAPQESAGISPFDDYDARTTAAETVSLLEEHGWKIVSRRGEAYYLKRPGKQERGISATFNHVPGRFYVFTTSTVFESEHVYKPYAVYAMLVHGGRFDLAAKALVDQGYGQRRLNSVPLPPTETKAADPSSLVERLFYLYDNGLKKGLSPGWTELAKLYQVVKGQLTIVTGIPSHGKSEFTDALMVNLAAKHKWRFVVYSPENYPNELHARKLIEKVVGLNMFGPQRFDKTQLTDAAHWVNDHFTFLDGVDESVTLDSIFQFVEAQIKIRPVDGVLIDPWNELESSRPEKMSETDFIGLCLKRARVFARRHEIAFWIVAHPFKMKKDPKTGDYPVPTIYDISGSAHWYNKADNAIVIFRDFANNVTRVIVEKIKFKYYGKKGEVEMKYDPPSGRLSEMANADHFKPEHNRQLPSGDKNDQ